MGLTFPTWRWPAHPGPKVPPQGTRQLILMPRLAGCRSSALEGDAWSRTSAEEPFCSLCRACAPTLTATGLCRSVELSYSCVLDWPARPHSYDMGITFPT